MKKAGVFVVSVLLAASLSACDKKGGDSNGSAAAPTTTNTTTTCSWNWQYNGYVDQNGNTCTPNNNDLYNTSYCHNYTYNQNTGQWVDQNGNIVNCNQGYIDFNYFMPYQYIHNGNYQANCSFYGPGWFPMQFGYSLVCVKYSYVNYYYPGFSYNPGYWYPYTCRYGVDCGQCSGASAGGNFGPLWFGGTLGICL